MNTVKLFAKYFIVVYACIITILIVIIVSFHLSHEKEAPELRYNFSIRDLSTGQIIFEAENCVGYPDTLNGEANFKNFKADKMKIIFPVSSIYDLKFLGSGPEVPLEQVLKNE